MASSNETWELVLACTVFVLIIIVAYICTQYLVLDRNWRNRERRTAGFCGGNAASLTPGSAYSRGVTCGTMPVIESVCGYGNGLCCGAFGVPV